MIDSQIDTKVAFDLTVKGAEELETKLRTVTDQNALIEESFTDAVAALERNHIAADAFLPATGATERLNFSRDPKDRRTLLKIYLDLLRDKLCTESSELYKQFQAGIHVTAGAIVSVIITTLGLSVLSFPIAIPLAVILLTTGVEAFCQWSKPK